MNTTLKLLLVIGFIICISQICCNTTEPPESSSFTAKVNDVSCTEAWIEISFPNFLQSGLITIKDEDKILKTISYPSSKPDTVVYIDSLLPNSTNNYELVLTTSRNSQSLEKEISFTTMDTTSHNFTFQTWAFGEIGNSVLYDVAIIDENNIWAVGEINIVDTSINGYTTYNAVHWDGNNWELIRIPYYYQGTNFYHPIKSVYAFGVEDILFCGNGIIQWDGSSYNPIPIPTDVWGPYQMNKLWGSSSDNMYVVGNNGNIAHYNGTSWQKIESGTTTDLNDISGSSIDNQIFISGYSTDLSRSILLNIGEGGIQSLWENNQNTNIPPYGDIIYSLQAIKNNLYVSSNDGVFLTSLRNYFPVKHLFYPLRRVYKIRGTNYNNIYSVGGGSEVLHFNGVDSRVIYNDFSTISSLYSAATKNNVIVAVGTKVENLVFHQAIILLGSK